MNGGYKIKNMHIGRIKNIESHSKLDKDEESECMLDKE